MGERAQLAGKGYKNRERQSNTDNSLRAVHPGRDAITLPSVVLHLTGSRQGNRGPPLPPPLIGCLCWLRHTGLAGPEGPAPRAGRCRRPLSCRSAAESQPLAWSLPPLRALGDCWLGGEMTSGGGQSDLTDKQGGVRRRRENELAVKFFVAFFVYSSIKHNIRNMCAVR